MSIFQLNKIDSNYVLIYFETKRTCHLKIIMNVEFNKD